MATITIPMHDELVHTDEQPFCKDATCPCQAGRFVTQELAREVVGEFDQRLQALRITWSGQQLFLDQAECYALLDLLSSVLPERRPVWSLVNPLAHLRPYWEKWQAEHQQQ